MRIETKRQSRIARAKKSSFTLFGLKTPLRKSRETEVMWYRRYKPYKAMKLFRFERRLGRFA